MTQICVICVAFVASLQILKPPTQLLGAILAPLQGEHLFEVLSMGSYKGLQWGCWCAHAHSHVHVHFDAAGLGNWISE